MQKFQYKIGELTQHRSASLRIEEEFHTSESNSFVNNGISGISLKYFFNKLATVSGLSDSSNLNFT
jgi:hypothetical protein